MKNIKFYIIIFLIIFTLIEIFSFLIINSKKENFLALIKNYDGGIKEEKIQKYSDNLPYVRKKSYYQMSPYKHLIKDENAYVYNIINKFNLKNNENILIQGDSEVGLLNLLENHEYLKKYGENNSIGILNAGLGSYSISPMSVQLAIFQNDLKIYPSIIIAVINQTDIGDEIFRYKNLKDNNFSISLASSDHKFRLKMIEDFKKRNLSTFKMIKYFFSNYIFFKNRLDLTNKEVINYFFFRIKAKFLNMPEVFYLLKRGINKKEKIIFEKRVNDYISQAFNNNNLKKIYFVTHPSIYHLKGSKKNYTNVSTIIDEIINSSTFKNRLVHINFNKNNNDINLNSFVKFDKFSHLTVESYISYYLPKIFSTINSK
jgi:hypothetical protein